MWKENIYRPFEIFEKEHSIFPLEDHMHLFYELVYIPEESGTAFINDYAFVFKSGAFFLIQPNIPHHFVLEKTGRILYFRFTKDFLEKSFDRHTYFLIKVEQRSQQLFFEEKDCVLLKLLLEYMVKEARILNAYTSLLLESLSCGLLLLTARNLSSKWKSELQTADVRIMEMTQYIRSHLGKPDLLRKNVLCKKFHLSEVYIGRYFKQHTQETLRQYIMRSRITLVEDLLLNTSNPLKLIAARAGFTDESHLIKTFKQHTGRTPQEYRRYKII